MIDNTNTTHQQSASACWFCERAASGVCRCRRAFCGRHGVTPHCMLCALAYGVYEERGTPDFVADVVALSLTAAANDPYIVVPPGMHGAGKLPMAGVERLISALVQVASSGDTRARQRVVLVLAGTTCSLSTMDPSQLTQRSSGTGLFSADIVRRALLSFLKENRGGVGEQTSVAVLDRLREADFRDLYPGISEKLSRLHISRAGVCLQELVQALGDLYPTRSYTINERCELLVYEQYTNRKRGAGDTMERMYGPKLRYAPPLARILKKGVFQSNYARFQDWYPGEDEPC